MPEHKGKVESSVHYVQRNLPASHDFDDLQAANQGALVWIAQVAGQRIHGTTKQKPLVRFQEVEQAALLPLSAEPYDLAVWKQVKVGRDCYVTFDRAHYSVPYRLVGQQVWVRGGLTSVRIYADHQLAAVHPRARQPGERHTVHDHLPPEKVAGLTTTREDCAGPGGRVKVLSKKVKWTGGRAEATGRTAGRGQDRSAEETRAESVISFERLPATVGP